MNAPEEARRNDHRWPPHAEAGIASLDLAVVIPTLNAVRSLERTIRALGPVAELVVVDGGSSDGTRCLARRNGARVIVAPRGRGGQIAAGVAATTRDWLLVLHADTQLLPGWRAVCAAHMRFGSGRAGWFRFALDSQDPRARRLERLVARRCRMLALPYGDQGLLVQRETLRAVGGMRPLPLMEDVDLVRRLGRRRLTGLAATALTSAAKWERDGWHMRSWRNIFCLTLWLAGVPPSLIVKIYR